MAAILLGVPAGAGPLAVEAEAGADHHVSAQGIFAGGLPHSWEWRLGSGRSAANIAGVSAHGLLAIHRITGQDAHRASALESARSLVRAFDGPWRNRRPKTQDVEFLAAAGFPIDAGRWFGLVTGRYSPAVYVDLVLSARQRARVPELAAWDGASAVRAALAVGQLRYARGLMRVLVQRRAAWDRPGLRQDLARGSLLWALSELRQRAGLTRAQQMLSAALLRDLLARQHASGAWQARAGSGPICTQTTAYAVLGLSRWAAGRTAASRGKQWLVRAALQDKRHFQGGDVWATTYTLDGRPDGEFNGEVQSEVLMALAAR